MIYLTGFRVVDIHDAVPALLPRQPDRGRGHEFAVEHFALCFEVAFVEVCSEVRDGVCAGAQREEHFVRADVEVRHCGEQGYGAGRVACGVGGGGVED